MATRTLTVGAFAGKAVRVEVDWDDATRRLATIRVVNGLAVPVRVQLVRQSDGRTVGQDFQPGTRTASLPASGVNRLFLDARGDGRLDGVDWQIMVPAPEA